MRFSGNLHWLLTLLCFLDIYTNIQCQSNSTTVASNSTTVASNTTTVAATTTTTAASTTTIAATQEVSANNVIWLTVGVVCGVIVVLVVVIGGCLAIWCHKTKKVHPQSDTDTIFSESDIYTRPTTASHIHFEPDEEEAMSKPVSMTPFELRKLYVETFPYSKWKKGFDGRLRPRMGLSFMDPRLYARRKNEEDSFRNQIYSFENSDSLTVRSNTVSRLTRPVITAMSNLEPLQEVESNNSDGKSQEPVTSRCTINQPSARSNRSDVSRGTPQDDVVDL